MIASLHKVFRRPLSIDFEEGSSFIHWAILTAATLAAVVLGWVVYQQMSQQQGHRRPGDVKKNSEGVQGGESYELHDDKKTIDKASPKVVDDRHSVDGSDEELKPPLPSPSFGSTSSFGREIDNDRAMADIMSNKTCKVDDRPKEEEGYDETLSSLLCSSTSFVSDDLDDDKKTTVVLDKAPQVDNHRSVDHREGSAPVPFSSSRSTSFGRDDDMAMPDTTCNYDDHKVNDPLEDGREETSHSLCSPSTAFVSEDDSKKTTVVSANEATTKVNNQHLGDNNYEGAPSPSRSTSVGRGDDDIAMLDDTTCNNEAPNANDLPEDNREQPPSSRCPTTPFVSEHLGDKMQPVSDGAPKVDNQQHLKEDGPGEAPCSTTSAGLVEDPKTTALDDGASKVYDPHCEDDGHEETTPHASSSTFCGCQGVDKTTKRSDEGGVSGETLMPALHTKFCSETLEV